MSSGGRSTFPRLPGSASVFRHARSPGFNSRVSVVGSALRACTKNGRLSEGTKGRDVLSVVQARERLTAGSYSERHAPCVEGVHAVNNDLHPVRNVWR